MAEKGHFEGEITEQLRSWATRENTAANDAFFSIVYDELRRQARRYMRKENKGHSLQTTALVHEAYLKLSKQKSVVWESRSHFFAVAATMMRRILIDHAKAKQRVRRGGVADDLPLENALTVEAGDAAFDLLELDEVLDRLAAKDSDLIKIVELRFFAGLDIGETASVMGISESTVKRDWAMAKAWLRRELTK